MSSKCGAVVQARMGSIRLPGKVLKLLAGKLMIMCVIERLETIKGVDKVILATSDLVQDDPLAKLAEENSINLFRGSEEDVLSRYLLCAEKNGLKMIVRATGDNPFVDPLEGGRLISFFRENDLEYATSFPDYGSGLPIGVGLEIFTIDALKKSDAEGTLPHHREHVNEYIQEHPERFKTDHLKCLPENRGDSLTLTVDTREDYEKASAIYDKYYEIGGTGIVPLSFALDNFN